MRCEDPAGNALDLRDFFERHPARGVDALAASPG